GFVPPTDLVGLCVLVVETNPTTLEILERQLRSWGMRVRKAGTTADALVELQKNSDLCHVILLDLYVSDLPVADFVRKVTTLPQTATTKFVGLTSNRAHADECFWSPLGLNACLLKPVRRSSLFDCLAVITETTPSRIVRPGVLSGAPHAPVVKAHLLLA